MKWILFVCVTVAAVQAVSEKENHVSDLMKLGVRSNEFCTLMKASEGPSFNPEDVQTVRDLAAMKRLYGIYGMAYNGGVMELTAEARNAEGQMGPGFRSHRPEGIYTDKSMASLYYQNKLFDLTPAQWEGLLGDRSNQTCDSTTYKPISKAHQIMKFPEISCNTICRTCFPQSLPICLKNQSFHLISINEASFLTIDQLFSIKSWGDIVYNDPIVTVDMLIERITWWRNDDFNMEGPNWIFKNVTNFSIDDFLDEIETIPDHIYGERIGRDTDEELSRGYDFQSTHGWILKQTKKSSSRLTIIIGLQHNDKIFIAIREMYDSEE